MTRAGGSATKRPEELKYVVIDHVVKIKDGEELVAFKNHFSVCMTEPSSYSSNSRMVN